MYVSFFIIVLLILIYENYYKKQSSKKAKELNSIINENPVSAYSDKAFLIFLIAMALFGIVFLQYFSTITIYYKDVHALSELDIGLLLGLNGFLIFIFEL